MDIEALTQLCGFSDIGEFRSAHRQWVERVLSEENKQREPYWSEAIAVGSANFVEQVRRELGISARYRDAIDVGQAYVLREPESAYVRQCNPGRTIASNGIKRTIADLKADLRA